MVYDKLGNDLQVALMGFIKQRLQLRNVAIGWVYFIVIGNIVAIVAQGRGIKRQ